MLLIKLLLAHVIGDFFTQSLKWVKHKEEHKLKSSRLYLHIGIHFALLFLILWDLTLWPVILIVGFSHFLIDALKLLVQNKRNRRYLFFIDQLLHLIVILVVWYFFSQPEIGFSDLFSTYNLAMLTAVLFLTLPVSVIMKQIFSKWDLKELTKGNESLRDAGKYIGILERLLVFVFVILGRWEAVGFLITAKSVFRFGDLRESKQRKLTEYVLIGTLISFGIAILIALLFLWASSK